MVQDVGGALALRHFIDVFKHLLCNGLSHTLDCINLVEQEFGQFDSLGQVFLRLLVLGLLLSQLCPVSDGVSLVSETGPSLVEVRGAALPLLDC